MTNHANYYHWLPAQFEGGYQGLNITEFLKVYGEDSLDKIGYGVPMAVEGKNSGLPQGNVITNGAKLFGAHLEDEPDKMGKMLQMIEGLETSLEMFQTAYMGFEGVSWEYNSEGAPVYIEPYNDVSELSAIGAQETMMSFDFPEFRWQTTEFGQQPWALSLGLDKGGLRANIMLPLETEAKYKADLDKLEEEMLVKIITGEEPLDYFDAFVEQWYNLGGREMTEEATRKLAEQRGL